MNQVEYQERFEDFVESILEKPTALGDWLTKHMKERELYGCCEQDVRYAVSCALHALFDRQSEAGDATGISADTIFGVEAEFLSNPEESLERTAGRLAVVAPKQHLRQKSLRRRIFLQGKKQISALTVQPNRFALVAEVMYLAIAIMEDREKRGMSLPM